MKKMMIHWIVTVVFSEGEHSVGRWFNVHVSYLSLTVGATLEGETEGPEVHRR